MGGSNRETFDRNRISNVAYVLRCVMYPYREQLRIRPQRRGFDIDPSKFICDANLLLLKLLLRLHYVMYVFPLLPDFWNV